MSDRLLEIEVFVRAAETGSLSRAGRELGLSQPSASRLVAALEARLGVRLLLRTTRKASLTEAGAAYLERARGVLLELGEAAAAARGAEGLQGVLRVALPVAFGAREVVPQLEAFLARHPRLEIELLMADRRQDLIEEGVDLALRLGPLQDSSFVARRLASAPRWPVAAPAYLGSRGEPATPHDLAGHDCILGPLGSAAADWTFEDPSGAAISAEIHGRLRLDSAAGVLAAVAAGLGIGIRFALDVQHGARSRDPRAALARLPPSAGRALRRLPGGPPRFKQGQGLRRPPADGSRPALTAPRPRASPRIDQPGAADPAPQRLPLRGHGRGLAFELRTDELGGSAARIAPRAAQLLSFEPTRVPKTPVAAIDGQRLWGPSRRPI
jgi:DNA-binding transcriptional LysR family regulator